MIAAIALPPLIAGGWKIAQTWQVVARPVEDKVTVFRSGGGPIRFPPGFKPRFHNKPLPNPSAPAPNPSKP